MCKQRPRHSDYDLPANDVSATNRIQRWACEETGPNSVKTTQEFSKSMEPYAAAAW